MRITSNIGLILLSIYLMVQGIALIIGGIPIPAAIIGALGIAAGIFLLIER